MVLSAMLPLASKARFLFAFAQPASAQRF